MRIKSYFAQSVQEAIEKARLELGPDAMLISSKKTGPEQGRLGAYEVVFGLSQENFPANAASSKAAASATKPESSDGLVRELADLRKQIENVRRSVSRQGYSRRTGTQALGEFDELHEWLMAADFSDEIAHELVQSLAARNANTNQEAEAARAILGAQRALTPELLCGALKTELEQRVRVAPELGAAGAEQRVVALVGPSGAGKTSSLVKLAVKYGVASRTPLQILSTDTLRVGGSEQLGAYAKIMGARFQAVPTMAALEQALEECRTKKLVLIDTPGYGASEMEEAGELKGFLARNPHIDVQLVLPATLRPTAVSSILGRFAIFRPSKLLLTHLDEAEMAGAVLDVALRSGLPISFLANGQQIPDDLEEASKERLTDKLFERVRAAALAAA